MGLIRRWCETGAVEIIGPSSEDEMVAAFLQAEIAGSRFEPLVTERIRQLGATGALVEQPNLANDADNELRSRLLAAHRGWRMNQFLFRGWPNGLVWTRAALQPADAEHIWYANAPDWGTLSRGTWRAADGARRVAAGDPSLIGWSPETLDAIQGIRLAIESGGSFPPIIAIGVPSARIIMLVEGHARMTAYLSLGLPD